MRYIDKLIADGHVEDSIITGTFTVRSRHIFCNQEDPWWRVRCTAAGHLLFERRWVESLWDCENSYPIQAGMYNNLIACVSAF